MVGTAFLLGRCARPAFHESRPEADRGADVGFGAMGAATPDTDFAAAINAAYTSTGPAIDLGRGVLGGALVREAQVRVPLATMNRHGLISGATGTGKTKTLQVLAEQLSAAGVPVFASDVKGDLSGVSAPAEAGGAGEKRCADLGVP